MIGSEREQQQFDHLPLCLKDELPLRLRLRLGLALRLALVGAPPGRTRLALRADEVLDHLDAEVRDGLLETTGAGEGAPQLEAAGDGLAGWAAQGRA